MSDTYVRTHYGEDIHPGTTWRVVSGYGSLTVRDANDNEVGHYPQGCWISVRGQQDAEQAVQTAAEPLKIGDKVRTDSQRSATATIIHIHEDMAWFSYGGNRNGVSQVSSLTKVEG